MSESLEQLTATLAERYRIERELGAGGMAIVYVAHDVKHNRQVALKVIKPELAAAIGAQRFLREIQVTANLQHLIWGLGTRPARSTISRGHSQLIHKCSRGLDTMRFSILCVESRDLMPS